MKRFGKFLAGAALAAGTMLGTTALTTTAADARVSVGIGIGVPGPAYGYGPGYARGGCFDPRWRYYHAAFCNGGYAYGPDYYGYYDTGFYGPGYYEPYAGGFWFTDSFGHRRWHGGSFHGGGFHGGSFHGGGHGGGGHWHH
jgi:hypothetical protein